MQYRDKPYYFDGDDAWVEDVWKVVAEFAQKMDLVAENTDVSWLIRKAALS